MSIRNVYKLVLCNDKTLSMKERMEMGIFRFLRRFSRIYKNGVKYKAERIGERANPWPTPMLTSKSGDSKSFQM